MRTITITYTDHGFDVEDSDGQSVFVEYEGDKALFVSKLRGDPDFVPSSCHRAAAEMMALSMVGVPSEDY